MAKEINETVIEKKRDIQGVYMNRERSHQISGQFLSKAKFANRFYFNENWKLSILIRYLKISITLNT